MNAINIGISDLNPRFNDQYALFNLLNPGTVCYFTLTFLVCCGKVVASVRPSYLDEPFDP